MPIHRRKQHGMDARGLYLQNEHKQKMAEDRKIMLYNQLLLRYNDIMKQKRKEEVPTIRIAKEKEKKPPSKNPILFLVHPNQKEQRKINPLRVFRFLLMKLLKGE